MKLLDWMQKNKVTAPALAKAIGCSRHQMWRYTRQYCRPSPEMADKITTHTGGRVKLQDLMEVDPNRPRRIKGGKHAAGKEA